MAKKKKIKKASKKPTKKITKKSTDQDFFAAINDPNTIRLSLLEGRRTVLESMKLFRELKDMGKEKRQQKIKLRDQIREISFVLRKIRSTIPEVKLKPEDFESSEKKQEPVVQEIQKPMPKRKKGEIDRIENELEKIEAKLSSL